MQKVDIAKRISQQAGILEYQAAKVLDQILELLKTHPSGRRTDRHSTVWQVDSPK